ncbi:MAG: glutamate-5-semialdehyde dehydrogenase [Pseudomonadota bacterium]
MNNTKNIMRELGVKARLANVNLAEATTDKKNLALVAAAKFLRKNRKNILAQNQLDVTEAEKSGMSKSMLDRLLLNDARIEAMAKSIEEIAELIDPIGKILASFNRPNGLKIERVSVPLGVIGIIYESRPNVTADAGALCIKSGNAVILRGGSDSFHSSNAIAECLRLGLKEASLNEDAIQIVPTRDREAVGIMLKMNGVIDVIIPRGGKSLTARVMKNSRVPTLLHLDGNCHSYIHASADKEMAVQIVSNAKMRRTGICGATESLVIDEKALGIFPAIADELIKQGCEIRGDARVRALDKRVKPARAYDWSKEYLDAIISVKTVSGIDEAIAHINKFGSHHTDAIITENKAAAKKFLQNIDSAIVIHNASTQFADGGEFGFGAEIGIATGRLHARGPVGIEQLTTYKYTVKGSGQIRAK